jgi:hypothetical protein
MKTNFTNNNTERISWLTLMNRNGYIYTAIIATALITGILINTTKWHLNWWEFTLAFVPPFGALVLVTWLGFYQYWKTFNKSYGWKIHTIMKGQHYSQFFRLPWFFKTKQSRVFMFAPECALATGNHINKLYRIGFGFLPFKYENEDKWHPAHHYNSVGYGWRGNGIGVEIYTYTYENGIRKTDLIAVVPTATPFYFDLDNINGMVLYSIVPFLKDNNKPSDLASKHKWPATSYGFKLGFYFGGLPTADRNYQVWEKR